MKKARITIEVERAGVDLTEEDLQAVVSSVGEWIELKDIAFPALGTPTLDRDALHWNYTVEEVT